MLQRPRFGPFEKCSLETRFWPLTTRRFSPAPFDTFAVNSKSATSFAISCQEISRSVHCNPYTKQFGIANWTPRISDEPSTTKSLNGLSLLERSPRPPTEVDGQPRSTDFLEIGPKEAQHVPSSHPFRRAAELDHEHFLMGPTITSPNPVVTVEVASSRDHAPPLHASAVSPPCLPGAAGRTQAGTTPGHPSIAASSVHLGS